MGFISAEDFNWGIQLENDIRTYINDILKPYVKSGNGHEEYDPDEDEYYWAGPSYSEEMGKLKRTVRDVKNSFVWACQDTNQLDIMDRVSNWGLRDLVAEADYQANKYVDYKNDYTEEEAKYHRAFSMWRRVVNYGSRLLTDNMLCTEEHFSQYDRL